MRASICLATVLAVSIALHAQTRPRAGQYGIVYASFAPLNGEIFIADADGGNPRPLSPDPGWDANASFSSDGRWVVFTSNRRGSADIFRIHPDGQGLFTRNVEGNYDVFTIRQDGSALRRLTTSPANDAHSTWSPDGQWIAFASGQAGFKDEMPLHAVNPQSYGEICVMRPDGSDIRCLTDNPFEDATPSWLPARALAVRLSSAP